ncbi:MAG: geranylgeranylglyceryl/heptaprenylglyceryl phosphate synthase [Desulfurococcales archaeon]|nr:geranylgeranylglyceryl/heptaprenylglyceryl phosphate synthase [Desulfurococcales archaeon]
MRGKITRQLLEKRRKCRLHFTLIDPDKVDEEHAVKISLKAKAAGTDAFLVGGSLGVAEPGLSRIVKLIKESTGLPVILFPSNVNGLTPAADAVLFLYLLNTMDPYYLSGAQLQGALIVLRMGLEPIPTAYVIVGHGGAAGYIGYARPVPYDKPEIAAAYALAGAMMGAQIVYLEAGSGAPRPVPQEAVSMTRKLLEQANLGTLIAVGGGVRDPHAARDMAKAGADILITGNVAEEDPDALYDIISSFKEDCKP